MLTFKIMWACPAEKGVPGYPLQVLALPSSGSGLSTAIPHANRFQKMWHNTNFESFSTA